MYIPVYIIYGCLLQIIRMLTEKCKNQEQIISEYEIREEQYQELEAEADLLKQQSESTRLAAEELN